MQSAFLAAVAIIWILMTGSAFSHSKTQSTFRLEKVNLTCPRSSLENNFTDFLYNPADGECHPEETRSTCPQTKKLVFDFTLTSEYRKQYNVELRFGKCDCLTFELYSPEFDKCYREGDSGDCPNGLVIVESEYEEHNYRKEHKLEESISLGFCGCKEAMTQYPCRSFPSLFSEKRNQCYEMYTQGPCDDDEWFTPSMPVDASKRMRYPGVYIKNNCSHLMTNTSSTNPGEHWYLHNGRCYQTANQGHCADPDQVSYFEYNYPLPECGDYDTVFGGCQEAPCSTDFSTLYHVSSNDCYEEGSQGPCPDTMVLQRRDPDTEKKYLKQFGTEISVGKCDCQSSTPQQSCSGRPYVFSPTLQQCVPAYSQGSCLDSEWMVPNPDCGRNEIVCDKSKNRLCRGVCVPNPCLKAKPVFPNVTVDEIRIFYYGSRNQCYLTGTKGDCTQPGDIAFFDESSFDPQCTRAREAEGEHGLFSPKCRPFSPLAGTTVSVSLGCPWGYTKRNQDCISSSDY